MRLLTISASLAALLGLAAAASIPGLPTCAGNCVPSDFGGCNQIDVKCICANSNLISNLACCVSTACSQADQETTLQFADALCAGQGVTNLPTAATCAATASASSSGTASTSAAATTSSVTGSAASSLSSAVSSASSVVASASSAASASTTRSSASSASAAATTATSATAATSSGVAGRVEIGMGLGAIVAGALAVL